MAAFLRWLPKPVTCGRLMKDAELPECGSACRALCHSRTHLMHGMPVQDALVIQPRRRDPLPQAVVCDQPHLGDANLGGLGHGHLCLPAGAPHAPLNSRIPGCDIHLNHWSLHQL